MLCSRSTISGGLRIDVHDGKPTRGFRLLVRRRHVDYGQPPARALFEFLLADEIFNVAEAIIRVYHEFGDYKHKQANRLKFLIKKLGWDGFLAEYHKKLEAFRAAGRCLAAVRSRESPAESKQRRRGARSRARPPILETVSRATSSQVTGPGIVPQVRPMLPTMNGDYSHWLSTNVRKQKQAGYCLRDRDDSARRFHEPADAHSRRSRRSVRGRHDPDHCRAGSRVPVGAG